jgi:hypothetical protein
VVGFAKYGESNQYIPTTAIDRWRNGE